MFNVFLQPSSPDYIIGTEIAFNMQKLLHLLVLLYLLFVSQIQCHALLHCGYLGKNIVYLAAKQYSFPTNHIANIGHFKCQFNAQLHYAKC